MAKEPQLLPGVPRERVYVDIRPTRGVTPAPKDIKLPLEAPTPPPPLEKPK